MATLPRDPLDELIADLERSLPVEAGPGQFEMPPPFEHLQFALRAVFGTDEDRLRAASDPHVQAVWKYFEKLGPVRNTRAEAASREASSPETERS